ncbi:hypothetical protein [Pasteurella multocida]
MINIEDDKDLIGMYGNQGEKMRKTALALLVEMCILGFREGRDGND